VPTLSPLPGLESLVAGRSWALTALVPVAGGALFALEANEDSYFNKLKTTRYHVTDSLSDPQFKFSGW